MEAIDTRGGNILCPSRFLALFGAHGPDHDHVDCLRMRGVCTTYTRPTRNLHAMCATVVPHNCLCTTLRSTYMQRDVAYVRVLIGLLTCELTRTLRISKRCLRTQQKRYETPGADYNNICCSVVASPKQRFPSTHNTHTCTHTQAYTQTCTHMTACTHTRTLMHKNTHRTHTHRRKHTHTHTHVRSHTHTPAREKGNT